MTVRVAARVIPLYRTATRGIQKRSSSIAERGNLVPFIQWSSAPNKTGVKLQHGEMTVKHPSKWGSLGDRVAKLKDGESIVIQHEGNLTEEARKIRNGLNGIAACILVRRVVRVVDGKIVITRVGTWPTLGGY